MITTIYRTEGRLTFASDRAILRTIANSRARFSHELLDDEYWFHVNLHVIGKLDRDRAPGPRAQAAERIHRRLLTDPDLYKVDRTLLRLIRRLRERKIRVVIASNQQEAALHALLRHFNLTHEVDEVYTSELLGVRKPNERFWQGILAQEGVGAGEAIHIDNSPRSGTGAAQLGIFTAILDAEDELDRCRRHPDRSIAGLTLEDTHKVRGNLERGLIVPFSSMKKLGRCMEERGYIS